MIIDQIDFDNIPLGKAFTDHMFICDYENGEWVEETNCSVNTDNNTVTCTVDSID